MSITINRYSRTISNDTKLYDNQRLCSWYNALITSNSDYNINRFSVFPNKTQKYLIHLIPKQILTYMNAKIFHIKVLQNKNKTVHPDVTQPQVATKADSNGNKGRYFHVSINAPLAIKAGGVPVPQQTRKIAFTIFENGNRSEIFSLLAETLQTEGAFTLANDGSFAKISETALGFEGDFRDEEVDFFYEMTDSDGKPLIDPATKKPRLRNHISSFIFASEDETGLAELIMAAEERRARKTEVASEDSKGTATTVE